MSRNAFAGLKEARFDAGIRTLSPVRGLRPVQAARLLVSNVPNPAILTVSSLDRASPIASSTTSTVSSAIVLLSPSLSATRPTIVDLFIASLPAPTTT